MRGLFLSVLAFSLQATLSGIWRPTSAAEIRSGEKVVVAADETIDDDLYVFGKEIVIDGTVEGDVIGWGQQITINGTVTGSVMAAGQTVVILGETGSARIAGQVLKIGSKAKLAGDLLAAGMSLECEKDSDVSGDALYAGYQALFAGKVGSDLRGGMANCRVEGSVGGDVHLEVGGDKNGPSATSFGPPPPVSMPTVPGGLTVGKWANIEGDLNYQSTREGEIDPDAKVGGEVKFRQQVRAEKNGKAGGAAAASGFSTTAFGRLRHIISVVLVGLVVLLLFPQWTTTWADTIRQRPAASFLSGMIGFAAFLVFVVFMVIAIVLAAVILFGIRITELAPLVLVGGFVGYAVVIVGFWVVTAFLAEAIAGLAIGRVAVKNDGVGARLGALALGVVLLGIILSVPYLGGLVGFVVMLFGLGSICLWLVGQSKSNVQSFEPLPPVKPIPA